MKEMLYQEDGQTYKMGFSQQLQQQTNDNLRANQQLYKRFVLLASILLFMMGMMLVLVLGVLYWLDKTNFLTRLLSHL